MTAKIVFDFWQENVQGCAIDALNLYAVHKKFSIHFSADKHNNDQISDLLHGHVSSTLMQTVFNQLINTISTKAFSGQPELENVMNHLYDEQDKSFMLKIWQNVLDETYAFMGEEDLLQQILLLDNSDLKLNLLEYLLTKYENQHKINNKFLPLVTFGVASELKQRQQQSHTAVADRTIGRLLSKLPDQLLIIFQSYNVSILNRYYNDYIFPERHNGSTTANKRFVFNFLPTKNNLRVKGKFKLEFNPRGLLTVGVPYGSGYKYLIADEMDAFICLDCVIDERQWWQVLWLSKDSQSEDQQFVLFQNMKTKKLLCSTSIINEYFVLISVLDFPPHLHDSQCHWKVVKRVK